MASATRSFGHPSLRAEGGAEVRHHDGSIQGGMVDGRAVSVSAASAFGKKRRRSKRKRRWLAAAAAAKMLEELPPPTHPLNENIRPPVVFIPMSLQFR